MTPRKFYLGFGPPLVKTTRGKVEYGIGSLPLGGYVKIPGMSRPSPGDLKATLPRGGEEAHRTELARLEAAIARGDYDEARPSSPRYGPRSASPVCAGARVVARAGCVLAAGDVAAARCDRSRPRESTCCLHSSCSRRCS